MYKLKIIGTGRYLPKKIVKSEEIDILVNKPKGWGEKVVGIKERRYVENETVSEMAKYAILEALEDANIDVEDIDILCYGGVTVEQPLPSTACFIQKALGIKKNDILSFDINSSCLSVVTAIDTMCYLGLNPKYRYMVVVGSEISSVGLNYKEGESAMLFGDGAAAIVLKVEANESSKIIYSKYRTYPAGIEFCQIYGGGSKFPANLKNLTIESEDKYKFKMVGKSIFKITTRYFKPFVDDLLKEANMRLEDIDIIVPHQASKKGIELIYKKLGVPKDKVIDIFDRYGNTIATSIPLALDYGIKSGKIKRGNKVLLLGTAAGVSFGGVILEY